MADWIAKLDDFLRLSEREILQHAGSVAHAIKIRCNDRRALLRRGFMSFPSRETTRFLRELNRSADIAWQHRRSKAPSTAVECAQIILNAY